MGVAGVCGPLVPAADKLQMRRRAFERAGSRAGSWRRCDRLPPVAYAHVKPSCDWAFDEPRILMVFPVICRLPRKLFRR
jgi:hypothetical protein